MTDARTTEQRFIIMTGDYRAQEVARNMTQAVVAAFKRRAPKNPGLLTRCRTSLRGHTPVWNYYSTEALLKRAGYKVNAR